MTMTSFFFSLLFLPTLSPSLQASNGGFRVELIHRDSPKSPLYNPNETFYQRILKALERSQARTQQSIEPKSKAFGYEGEYLMSISIGTPPFEIIVVADTGSDLTWTQCAPCRHCYKQDRPLFQPKLSQTYTNLPCDVWACEALFDGRICGKQTCHYLYSYTDGSQTRGKLASETITMSTTSGVPVSIPNIAFGCSHNSVSNTTLLTNKTSGIVGLGGGQLSLVSQIGYLINWKFSYCLVPNFLNISSTLSFGLDSFPNGPGVMSTPLYTFGIGTSYFLSLEGFTVGNTYIKMTYPFNQTDGANIIVDSGTTFTFLPDVVVGQLSAAIANLVNATRVVSPVPVFNLCYTTASFQGAPTIVAHFSGGADVELEGFNTFVPVSDAAVCFNFISVDPQNTPVFGNFAQMNYVVAYDLLAFTVSFKKADCTTFL